MEMPLSIKQLLGSKKVIFLLAGIILLVIFGVVLSYARSFLEKETTPNEIRTQSLEYMVMVLEQYAQQNNAYPQPTVRTATHEGVNHVWGYEPKTASLASCTVAKKSDGSIDPEQSHCGGEIYDAKRNLLGWKGVLTTDSGLNNVEIANKGSKGRVSAPLSALVPSIPTDPAYAALPELAASGFGEFVYAVRAPEDGAEGRGGMQYQIGLTMHNPETGEKQTYIRGNYFVPSEDRNRYPVSLIGPGLLMDNFGNPIAGQDLALHVLSDQQMEGFPNPALGAGKETLQRLVLERRAQRFAKALRDRLDLLAALLPSHAVTAIRATLEKAEKSVSGILTTFASDEKISNVDMETIETALLQNVAIVEEATKAFLDAKALEVEQVLEQEVEKQAPAIRLLQEAFTESTKAEEAVLVARDEMLKYLDGEGIEEQSRNRAARKLQLVHDDLPDFADLFSSSNLVLPLPFISDDQHENLQSIAAYETPSASPEGSNVPLVPTIPGDTIQPKILVTTIAAELYIHFNELKKLLTQLQENLENNAVPAEEIDGSLHKLSRALATENERIEEMFESLDDVEVAQEILEAFQEQKEAPDTNAIDEAAKRFNMHGDFSPILFSGEFLTEVSLEQSPGVPDFDAYENTMEARYQGIPYPLP